ncbi:putative Dicer endoribonuclease [Hamiltosporidium magnivora]|uniref:Putative Dicer endoribonuclease n=1 Tax=Hamiltosporidium magnivora TaxID=148818 RepID=A0A4Q9LDP2_9MICR|nr:putative Dicer endoribonuclease [Hamiltosporidium magnivora]
MNSIIDNNSNNIRNEIFLENEFTTSEIKKYIHDFDRILLIVEQTSTEKYDEEVIDLRTTSVYDIIYQNTIFPKIMITPLKFFYLSKHGILTTEMFDILIIRLDEIKKEFSSIFKHFYYLKIRDCILNGIPNITRPLVVRSFLRKINYLDPIYLHSKINNSNVSNNKPSIKLYILESVIDENVLKYIELKKIFESAIKKETHPEKIFKFVEIIKNISFLEKISYKLSMDLLNNGHNLDNIDVNKIKENKYIEDSKYLTIGNQNDNNTYNILNNNKNTEENNILAINERKYQKLKDILKDNSNLDFYISTTNKFVVEILSKTYKNIFYLDEKISNINFENSILVFYEYINIEMAAKPFKEIFVFNRSDAPLKKFIEIKYLRNSCINKESDEDLNNNLMSNDKKLELFNYLKSIEPELYIPPTSAYVSLDSAFLILTNFFYLLKNVFDDNFLFIRNLSIQSKYESQPSGFVCIIILPRIHNHFIFSNIHISKVYPTKKESQKDAALNILQSLYDEKLINDYLLPITTRFINENFVYFDLVKKIYRIDISNDILDLRNKLNEIREESFQLFSKDPIMKPEMFSLAFKKKYSINLEINNSSERTCDISTFHQLQPKCLSFYPTIYFLYVFNEGSESDDDVGICCGESFIESVNFKGIEIKFLKSVRFSSEDLFYLLFYQIAIFSLYFKKTTTSSEITKDYCYYYVPIKNGSVNMNFIYNFSRNFLRKNVYECELLNLKEEIFFNPFSGFFYTFKNFCNFSIHSKKNFTSLDKYESLDDKSISFYKYFQQKYDIKLKNDPEDMKLLFDGTLYSLKGETSVINTLSSELVRNTGIKKSEFFKFQKFKKYFYAFESVSLAFELKNKLGICINSQLMSQCLSLRSSSFGNRGVEYDYERLEFLGDSVLKFIVSKHLLLVANENLKYIVTKKDSFISNDHLFEIAKKLSIPYYFSFIPYCDKLFQAPNIFMYLKDCVNPEYTNKLFELLKIFKTESIFQNNDQSFYLNRLLNKKNANEKEIGKFILSKKTCADILEAIIGAHFIEFGIKRASDFIYKINIIEPLHNLPEKNSLIEEICLYKEILKEYEIENVEKILNYKFKNKGLIEKALIHPSSYSNVLGSIHFNKLELLGDCILDLCITRKIFNENKNLDPSGLHSLRKSFVNNYSLARALFKSNLVWHTHTHFSKDDLHQISLGLIKDGNKVNKMFGDLFEAVCGAIAIDMNIDFDIFETYFNKNFYDVLNVCVDSSR